MATILVKAVAPGRAQLRISPWEGSAESVELSIHRSEGARYLDVASRQWVGDEQWIRLNGATVEGEALLMPVGPEFVDTLLAGTQGPRARGFLRIGGGDAVQHGLRVEPDVLPSTAAGATPVTGGNSQLSAPATVEDVVSEPIVAIDPPVDQPRSQTPQRPRRWPLLLVLLAAVAAAAFVAYFLLLKDRSTSAESPRANTPDAQEICSAAALPQAGADAMSFVQRCVRDVKDPAALLTVIQAARDAGQCEIAQRLYANRANAGDISIALAYAQEYDPASSKSSCFKPEAATARYWYEAVLEKDPKQADARAKLQALPN